MAILPSNVPTEGTLPLIVMDHLDGYLRRRPANATLRAWAKFEETERRHIYFEWFTHCLGKRWSGFQSLVDDAATAFLMSFEAGFQLLLEESFKNGQAMDKWLETRPEYDLVCRGLRTMRNAEAHLSATSLGLQVNSASYSIFGSGGDPGRIVLWVFPTMDPAKLPRSTKLDVGSGELALWNDLVEATAVSQIMRRGLAGLHRVLEAAEII